MNDDALAAAARRLKARTGAGYRVYRGAHSGVPIFEVDDLLEQEAMAVQLTQEMARSCALDAELNRHTLDCVDLVQGPDGIWHLPGANNGNGREDEPGRITRALGFQPEQ